MAAVRCFVAVVPPPGALATLVRAVEPLRALPATWVPAERLHVTLVFLGEVADPAPYAAALAPAVAETAAFELRIRGGGAFPGPARARVLWAGLDGDVAALARLARVARRTARAARIDVERKPYVPHVTVARVRRDGFDGAAAVAALGVVEGEPWQVAEVVLMRSVPGPKPAYEPLRRLPLYT